MIDLIKDNNKSSHGSIHVTKFFIFLDCNRNDRKKKFSKNSKYLFDNVKTMINMTKNEMKPGDNGMFYLHALSCYFPQLSKNI